MIRMYNNSHNPKKYPNIQINKLTYHTPHPRLAYQDNPPMRYSLYKKIKKNTPITNPIDV